MIAGWADKTGVYGNWTGCQQEVHIIFCKKSYEWTNTCLSNTFDTTGKTEIGL